MRHLLPIPILLLVTFTLLAYTVGPLIAATVSLFIGTLCHVVIRATTRTTTDTRPAADRYPRQRDSGRHGH